MEKLYFVDSIKEDIFLTRCEEYPTKYCNNEESLKKIIEIMIGQGRTKITTGEAYFNSNGILVKDEDSTKIVFEA